jgi:SAM-dependent methyltransferase
MACLPKSGQVDSGSYTLDLVVEDLKFKLPPSDIGARIGVTNLIHYMMFGRSIFHGFEKALMKNFGKSFTAFSTIVDWGCGSARVARHVLASLEQRSKLIGFDIDGAAVEWANMNVGPYFKACKVSPPLDQATGSVDLVYAYSVFTHLAAHDLTISVKETARILKPAGVGLFTVLSDRAMIALQCGLSRLDLEAWRECGIFDSMKNTDLDAIQADDYYRNVWVRRYYIERVFKGLFEIVDFIGSFHFYQDLVVVRRL